jgi:hypothetical protein
LLSISCTGQPAIVLADNLPPISPVEWKNRIVRDRILYWRSDTTSPDPSTTFYSVRTDGTGTLTLSPALAGRGYSLALDPETGWFLYEHRYAVDGGYANEVRAVMIDDPSTDHAVGLPISYGAQVTAEYVAGGTFLVSIWPDPARPAYASGPEIWALFPSLGVEGDVTRAYDDSAPRP